MLFWTGWGILALPMVAAGGWGGTTLGTALGSSEEPNLGTAFGLLAAGAALWLLGQRLNAPQAGFHPQTGQPVLYANRHRLWFVPLQWWGAVTAVGALVVAVLVLLP